MATNQITAAHLAELGLKIVAAQGVPIYQQIRDHIVEMVSAGRLKPGYRLPTVRGLAGALKINPMTVAKAYKELAASGLAAARRGGGTQILHPQESGGARDTERGSPQRDAAASVSISQRLFELARAPGVIAFTGNYPRPEDADVAGFRTCLAALVASDAAREYFRYDPPGGRPELQNEIAAYVAEQGMHAAPDDIVVTAGGQQAIDLVARVMVAKGAAVICERPAYFGALNVLRAARAQILEVPVRADGMDLDVLESHLRRHRPRLIYTNPTFQNPSGVTASLEKRKAMLDLARRSGIAILEDDHCPELRFRGAPTPSLRALAGPDDLVFYARGFGKTLVPGIRLGFLIVPPRFRSTVLATKALADLQSNALLQGALARYLAAGKYQAAVRDMRRTFERRQALLLKALRTALPEGVAINQPDGGLSLWLTLPAKTTTPELYFRAARHGVTFIAGDVFYATKPDHMALRLSFGLIDPDNIAEGAKRICALTQDLLRPVGLAEIFV